MSDVPTQGFVVSRLCCLYMQTFMLVLLSENKIFSVYHHMSLEYISEGNWQILQIMTFFFYKFPRVLEYQHASGHFYQYLTY